MRDWHSKGSAARALWLCAALSVSGARPAAAEVVKLAELERSALAARPQLTVAEARIRSARYELEHAKSAYMPEIGLLSDFTLAPGRTLVRLRDQDGQLVRVQGASDIRQAGAWQPNVAGQLALELRATLYDFGRTDAAVERGRAGTNAAAAAEQSAREAIVLEVRVAYLRWLAQAELFAIAEQAAADASARSQRVQALIAEGARPKSELAIVRADELLAALELERARGELSAARLELEQAVAAKLPANAEPDRGLLNADSAGPPATSDPPALLALAAEQRATEAEADQLERADAPTLSAGVQAGMRASFQNEDSKLFLFPAYSGGLRFSLPLWDGGSSSAAASAARARADALAAELDAERGRQRDAIARAALDRDNAGARLRAAEALLQVARTRADEAQQAYDLGAMDLGALADARALLRRAKTEVLHEQLARAEARLSLRSHP